MSVSVVEKISRRDDFQARKVSAEPAGISREQRPALDGGMRADEEVGQHLGLAAAAPAVLQVGLAGQEQAGRGSSCIANSIVATTRSSASKVENDSDSSA